MTLLENYKNFVLENCNKEVIPIRNNCKDNEVRITYTKKRIYGLKPLNKKFKGSHLHHLHEDKEGNLNHSICIYIPRWMHQDNTHNSVTWLGMEKINKLSWEFLEWQKKRMNFCPKCNEYYFKHIFNVKDSSNPKGLCKVCYDKKVSTEIRIKNELVGIEMELNNIQEKLYENISLLNSI